MRPSADNMGLAKLKEKRRKQMDYKKLFHKIIALLSSPGKTWTEISEGGEERNILGNFVYPLIGLCSMAEFIGAFLGRDITPDVFQNALRSCCALAVALFGGFFLAVYLIEAVGRRWFATAYSSPMLHTFVGYSMVVTFVLDMVSSFFPIAILHWILQLYTLFVVFEGARRFLRVPETRLTSYTLVSTLFILLSPAVIESIFNKLTVILN